MKWRPRADAIDTGVVLRVYTAIAGVAGFAIGGWGSLWWGAHLPEQPWSKAALIRVAGAIVIGAACCAAGLASAADPVSRRRGLGWFAYAHGMVALVVAIEHQAIWNSRESALVAWTLGGVTLVLAYLWDTTEGDPPNRLSGMFQTLFGKGGRGTTERLRTAYEMQIRQAAAQEERNRLARDLHDSIKQQIFAMQTSAATAQVRFDNDAAGAKQALDQVRSAARDAMTEMEAMLDQLRAAPLENTGLVEALKKQCEALRLRTGANVDFRCDPLPPNDTIEPGGHLALFRVAQEALANVARHARASHVEVGLYRRNGKLVLSVKDDGGGFDTMQPGHGMGLANMRARAAEFGAVLEVQSRPGHGASVSCGLPYIRAVAGDYSLRARIYGMAFFAAMMAGAWTKNPGLMILGMIALIGAGRQTRAWLRSRGSSE